MFVTGCPIVGRMFLYSSRSLWRSGQRKVGCLRWFAQIRSGLAGSVCRRPFVTMALRGPQKNRRSSVGWFRGQTSFPCRKNDMTWPATGAKPCPRLLPEGTARVRDGPSLPALIARQARRGWTWACHAISSRNADGVVHLTFPISLLLG